MKNKILNGLIILSFIVLLIEILLYKTLINDTLAYSLDIWITTLLPTMFPFFVISDILISYDITHYIPKFIKKTFCKCFNVSEPVITIFFLSCISGFPSNARNTRNLYDRKEISKEEATHALLFTHFSNPLFILSTVAVSFLQCERCGYIILISHYLGNVFLGLFTRNLYTNEHNHYTSEQKKSQNFSNILIHAIRSSLDTILLIFGTLTCFLILSSLIIQQLRFSSYPAMLLKGILEITMGIKSLALLTLPTVYKVVIATTFLSFGGLSVHLQVLSQLADTDIPYQPFLVARIFHALISGLLAFFLFQLFM